MTTASEFWRRTDEFAKLGRPKVAFGLSKPDGYILESLRRSQKLAEIVLVGPLAIASIPGFQLLIDEQPEEKLASLLANGEVEGIVRGTIDGKKTLHAYQRLTGEVDRICPALMEVAHVRINPQRSEHEVVTKQFFICPVSNTDGWTREQRFGEAR